MRDQGWYNPSLKGLPYPSSLTTVIKTSFKHSNLVHKEVKWHADSPHRTSENSETFLSHSSNEFSAHETNESTGNTEFPE